jgi:transcriptional regulator with XRE-family HTH domain
MTMAQTKDRYWKNQRVEVQQRSATGRYPVWKEGVVKEVAGKGCFVVAHGNSNFYHWSDIRPLETDKRARDEEVVKEVPSPRTSLGPLLKVVEQTTRQNLAELVKIDDEADEAKAKVEAERERVMEDRSSIATSRQRFTHQLTEIGNLWRAERMRRALSQRQVATLLGMGSNYKVISDIELGDRSPSDELLLKFSAEFGVDLGKLEEARDGKKPPPSMKEEPVLNPPLKPASIPASPAVLSLTKPTDFIEFAVLLKTIIPCPTDAAKRAAWMTAAEQLWALSEGA